MSARRPQLGNRVTCKRAVRPYSSSAYDWKRSGAPMFEPGMFGEIVRGGVPCVRAVKCATCGSVHQTFALMEFQWRADSTWQSGAYDRVGLFSCNIDSV